MIDHDEAREDFALTIARESRALSDLHSAGRLTVAATFTTARTILFYARGMLHASFEADGYWDDGREKTARDLERAMSALADDPPSNV